MSKLIMLVGLPGSGKSALAESLEDENTVIIPADKICRELFLHHPEHPRKSEFVDVVHRYINDLLESGNNVIYDATNIYSDKRREIIQEVLKADKYICYSLNTPLDVCIERDNDNKFGVGANIILDMHTRLSIPSYSEGWDDIKHVVSGIGYEGDSQ